MDGWTDRHRHLSNQDAMEHSSVRRPLSKFHCVLIPFQTVEWNGGEFIDQAMP